jgi:hypothetical protein
MSNKKLLFSLLAVVVCSVLIACRNPATPSGEGSLRVLVLGIDNEPLTGAKVISSKQPEGQLKVTGITQTEGLIEFSNIKVGTYEFDVSRFDYEQQEFSVSVVAGRTTITTITLVSTLAKT